MPAKSLKIKVISLESELEFDVFTTITGKQLFDQVVNTMGVREVWYFGLMYQDTNGMPSWINVRKTLREQDLPKQRATLYFRAKFYPEDVEEDLIEENTVKLFYLQVKEAILKNEIFCPAETAVLLASHALQAKYGDYHTNLKQKITEDISYGKVLSDSVTRQHTYSPDEWFDIILNWYEKHSGNCREDSMLEYLKIAQDLDMYGVSYFSIANKKGTELALGVDAMGVNIYQKDNKLTPEMGFTWSEISNISFHNKYFKIKPIVAKAPDFVVKVDKVKTNVRILAICEGNHEMYSRRRRPDSIEIQQMRSQAKDRKSRRLVEQDKLKQEQMQRRQMEEKLRELEEMHLKAKQEAEEHERRLRETQEENAELRRKLKEIQDEIERISNERQNLKEEMDELLKQVEQGTIDRDKFLAEMQMKEEEYARVQEELNMKVTEASQLQSTLSVSQQEKEEEIAEVRKALEEEMKRAEAERRRAEETNEAYLAAEAEKARLAHEKALAEAQISQQQQQQQMHLEQQQELQQQLEEQQRLQQEQHEKLLAMTTKVENSTKQENSVETTEKAEVELSTVEVKDEVERVSQVDKNKKLQKDLSDLSKSLKSARNENTIPLERKIHDENIKQGKDKYKTLLLIRANNTKKRVEMFENL